MLNLVTLVNECTGLSFCARRMADKDLKARTVNVYGEYGVDGAENEDQN